MDSNSIGRRHPSRRQKSPCGAFLDARLAQSTRAHQENACVEIHERFSFAQTANSRRRVDSNSIGRRYPSRRQKSPCGAFLDARLAQSTRAHQENACVEIHERFSFAQTANSRRRVDSNSIGRRYPSRRQKSPCGAFLDARLAQSTRAHQELQYPNRVLEFLFCRNISKGS